MNFPCAVKEERKWTMTEKHLTQYLALKIQKHMVQSCLYKDNTQLLLYKHFQEQKSTIKALWNNVNQRYSQFICSCG